jgi:glycerophosphoryl diester phosphodiesterase
MLLLVYATLMIVKHQNLCLYTQPPGIISGSESKKSDLYSNFGFVEFLVENTELTMKNRKANMDLASFEKPLIMGHRGYQARYPENTVVSFLAAAEAGAQFVELDVTLTHDQQVVVIHDDTVDRTTDGSGRVSGYDLGALQQLDAGSWFHPRFAGERIPALDDVLKQVAPRAHINIEIKSHQLTDPGLVGLIEKAVINLVLARRVKKRVLVSSFDQGVLKRIKQLDPAMDVALISKQSPLEETVAVCLELGVFSYHPHLASIDRDLVEALHRAGVHIFPWNIDDAGDIQHAFSLGVDGLIAKDPLLVRQCYNGEPH